MNILNRIKKYTKKKKKIHTKKRKTNTLRSES